MLDLPSGLPASRHEVERLFEAPLLELVFAAAQVHRQHHDPRDVQLSSLLSIKTGACPEDCGYCPQSAHHAAPVQRESLLDTAEVLKAAARAQQGGADRFCMGAAWREVRDGRDLEQVCNMVAGVKALGMETCVTLGMLTQAQAERLKTAGLDYYNHNLDTSREYYGEIITTRSYDDRLRTLSAVRAAGLSVCCGGIVGLGESQADRAGLLLELARMEPPPESVPINALVPVAGTPLGDRPRARWDEIVRTVAVARLLMPRSTVRLSAGRQELGEAAQALCHLAGANSIFLGARLLTTNNPAPDADAELLLRLGLRPQGASVDAPA